MRFRDKVRARAGVLTIGTSVLLGGVYFAEVRSMHAHAECQAEFNQTFVEVITVRLVASNPRLDALSSLLDGLSDAVLKPDKDDARTKARYRALFQRYDEAAADYRRTQDSVPLPMFPSC